MIIIERTCCAICGDTRHSEFAELDHRRVVRCSGCGYVFAWQFDEGELDAAYREDYYASVDDARIEQWVADNQGVWDGLCDTLARYKPDTRSILDVGAGTGGFLLTYHGKNPGVKLFAIESSDEARRSLEERLPGVEFVARDASQVGEREDAYDAITLLQTLEHVYEPAAVCAGVHRALAPGGVFLVTVPNRHSYAVALKGTRDPLCYGNRTHLQFFEKRSLERMLSQAGFARFERVTGFGGSNVTNPMMKLAQYALRRAGKSNELRYVAWKG